MKQNNIFKYFFKNLNFSSYNKINGNSPKIKNIFTKNY